MTKFGETNGFRASDFVREMESYLDNQVLDYVIVNKARPSAMRFRPYVQERSEFVEPDLENLKGSYTVITSSLIKKYGLVRHDQDKVAKMVKMAL